MTERSESDIVLQATIKVMLGGQEFGVKPLSIRQAGEWRKKAVALMAPLPKMVEVTTDTPEEFGDVLTMLMVTMPDQVVELFFDYATDLDREWVETHATEAELAVAFEEISKVAFPLAESPLKMMSRLSQ